MSIRYSMLLLGLSLSLPSSAGLLLERELSGGIRQQHLYQAGAYVSLENGQLQGVVDLKQDHCLSLDPGKKIYFEGSCQQLGDTIKQQYQAMTKELSQRYASLSMQQREGLIKSRAGIIAQKQATKVASKFIADDKYQGYQVKKWMLTVDGKDYAEYWISAKLQQDISKEFDIKAYDAWQLQMTDQMRLMEIKLFGGTVPDPLKDEEQKLYQQGQILKLLPSPTLQLDGSRDYQSNSVTRIEHQVFDVKAYQPPKEFKALASWTEFLQASEQ